MRRSGRASRDLSPRRGQEGEHFRSADVPIFDILFGTFDNPRDFAPANGFYDGASLRLGEMLVFRDVAEPPASAARAAA